MSLHVVCSLNDVGKLHVCCHVVSMSSSLPVFTVLQLDIILKFDVTWWISQASFMFYRSPAWYNRTVPHETKTCQAQVLLSHSFKLTSSCFSMSSSLPVFTVLQLDIILKFDLASCFTVLQLDIIEPFPWNKDMSSSSLLSRGFKLTSSCFSYLLVEFMQEIRAQHQP